MSKTLSLAWNELRFGGLRMIFESVESALSEAGVDFYYLIGAQARELWYIGQTSSSRITRDVDFAIMVANSNQFATVKNILRESHRYESLHGDAIRLRSPDGSTVDILPFSGMEDDDKAILDGHGLTTIQVDGFREVAIAGTSEAHFAGEGGPVFRLATLPAIVLLKLIAYDDRPDQRAKDPEDIAYIISTYFDVASEVFFDAHHDVLQDIDKGREIIGARVIGREMKPILDQSESLDKRIRSIIDRTIAEGHNSGFTQTMARTLDKSIEDIIPVLESLRLGLDEPQDK